ncbi:tryptophan synthase beta subunit-like PLP-dependent enzyme [Epithele typhae]|uniref:tryptophan synthase beta subunit-like PLP-dependent enzyme n=1 Tax=Epithele typhae TaxID=378194 RepID=UPI002008C879|nr:tryptophan synthase beta subunit-like PLP-dependent enzyme [Epithele typhae]KAH9946307.1 tryptophan synthase beta subunit-like PLP-dependent enzyme [Epithele typhae]
MDPFPNKLWLETPLIRSTHLSSLLGANIYLKLDNLQPAQSFKSRGISHYAQNAFRVHGPDVHLIIASGGNAGLAAACAAHALGVRCTVFLPEWAGQATLDFLRKQGAEVVKRGTFYFEALAHARDAVAADPKAVMVPAYDDPLLWEGHASLVHEIRHQLPEGTKPAAVFCSVGGAGLAGGIMTGLKAVGWDDVSLVTVETHGASCFYQSLSLNDGKFPGEVKERPPPEGITAEFVADADVTVAHVAKLTSKATSLGASSPSAPVVKMALQRSGEVKSICIPDEMAMQATSLFAADHKILVELACSATLAPAYKPELFRKLVPQSEAPPTVVLIVCGGFNVTLADLEDYKNVVGADIAAGGVWEVAYNGAKLTVPKAQA